VESESDGERSRRSARERRQGRRGASGVRWRSGASLARFGLVERGRSHHLDRTRSNCKGLRRGRRSRAMDIDCADDTFRGSSADGRRISPAVDRRWRTPACAHASSLFARRRARSCSNAPFFLLRSPCLCAKRPLILRDESVALGPVRRRSRATFSTRSDLLTPSSRSGSSLLSCSHVQTFADWCEQDVLWSAALQAVHAFLSSSSKGETDNVGRKKRTASHRATRGVKGRR